MSPNDPRHFVLALASYFCWLGLIVLAGGTLVAFLKGG